MPVVLVLIGCLGLAIGSFLNVVAYRVPAGLSVVSPPSACPRCGHEITARDNVPILSWVLLRASCRSCKAPISVRYPIVEAITGVLFLVVSLRFAPAFLEQLLVSPALAAAAGLEWIAFLYLGAISVALAAIDLDVRRLPDRIVLPSYLVGVGLLGGADALRGDLVSFAVAAAVAGGSAALYGVLWLTGGMGAGDVKLAGVLGLFLGQLGLAQAFVGTAAAFVIGGAFGVSLLIVRAAERRTPIPFGPWMLLGAWIGVLAGPALGHLYLRLVGLA